MTDKVNIFLKPFTTKVYIETYNPLHFLSFKYKLIADVKLPLKSIS